MAKTLAVYIQDGHTRDMNTATLTATAVRIGTCVVCKTTYRAEFDGFTCVTDLGGETRGYCGCRKGQGFTDTAVNFGKDVVVTYAAEVTCGQRCYIAKSAKCTCSCSGKQHGAAHKAA